MENDFYTGSLNSFRRKCSSSILSGFCLPDPYHQIRVQEVIEKFMNTFRDPSLPLLELQVNFTSNFCVSILKKWTFCAIDDFVVVGSDFNNIGKGSCVR